MFGEEMDVAPPKWGVIDCPQCIDSERRGYLKCPRCNGYGQYKTPFNPYVFPQEKMVGCERCNGAGWLTCPRCHGTTKIRV